MCSGTDKPFERKLAWVETCPDCCGLGLIRCVEDDGEVSYVPCLRCCHGWVLSDDQDQKWKVG